MTSVESSNELLQKVLLSTAVNCCRKQYFPQLFTFFSSCTIYDQKEALSAVNNNVETAVFHASCIKCIFS